MSPRPPRRPVDPVLRPLRRLVRLAGRLVRTVPPRSVRARLVAIYTGMAVVLAAVGLLLFIVLAHRSLNTSLDASLDTRAAPLVASVSAPTLPDLGALVGPADATRSRRDDAPLAVAGVTVVLRPDGRVAAASPAGLPADLLARMSRLGSGRQSSLFTSELEGGEHLRILLVPARRADGIWVVAVGADLDVVRSTAEEAIHQLLLAVPVFIALAALGAWFLSGGALAPVERMRADAETIGERDLDTRISVPDTADELARLARTFNALLDRLRRSADRQRDLVADAGHELRTPLAVLSAELELADRPGRDRAELADAITHARGEVDRLTRLAADLLFLARADGAGPIVEIGPVDLGAVLVGTVRASRARAEAAGVALDIDAPPELPAWADSDALRRAVDNLVANAVVVTPPGGRVTVSAAAAGGELTISVADSGPGFPPEFLAHAFARFRRADASRATSSGGAGLGLAIVAEIVRAHGGTASAVNRPSGGAEVTLHLPQPAEPE